jgi:hypothetical protein
VGAIIEELHRCGCQDADISLGLKFGIVLGSTDRLIFGHRPAPLKFVPAGMGDVIASYGRDTDTYKIHVTGLLNAIQGVCLETEIELGRSCLPIRRRVTPDLVLRGIAIHEVRHRLQKHLSSDLLLWTCEWLGQAHPTAQVVFRSYLPAAITTVEEDALIVEHEFYIQWVTGLGIPHLGDLIWSEPTV